MTRIKKAIEYIEYNPVRRGLVSEATDWRWSSAQARAGKRDVPILIDAIEFDHGEINHALRNPEQSSGPRQPAAGVTERTRG